MSDAANQRIGDYEILKELGAGGMGKVYQVRNVITDRVEAMKVLLPDLASTPDLAARFLREVKLTASLDHPNICALRTAFSNDNRLYMVMEYVEGTTMATKLDMGPLTVNEAVKYISQVLSAVSYAHKLHIIHRDIKPANMMLTANHVVKLMDFGIARAGEERAEVGFAVGGEIGLVEIGREELQKTSHARLVAGLDRVGEGEEASGLQHPGDLGGDQVADLWRQFVEEIDGAHAVHAGVGEGKAFAVGLDERLDARAAARLLQIGAGQVGADQAGGVDAQCECLVGWVFSNCCDGGFRFGVAPAILDHGILQRLFPLDLQLIGQAQVL